jgi:predicted double-glycine peptidase
MRRMKRTLLAAALLLLPAFCTTGATLEGPDVVILRQMPFFAQETYQCGPAALATVVDYWQGKLRKGTWISPDEIAAAIYSPSARGVLTLDLEAYARKRGFEATQYSGSLDDLKRQIDRGVPAIILVDYGFSLYEANHFMVVKGYSSDGVIVNSGRRENQLLPEGELQKIWKKTRRWTLVLKPSV